MYFSKEPDDGTNEQISTMAEHRDKVSSNERILTSTSNTAFILEGKVIPIYQL